MPRVPVYDEQQVSEAPVSGVKYQNLPDTGLADLGNAASKVGNLLDKRAEEMQEEDDAAQLTEVYAAASDRARQILNGEGGVLNRTGKDAFGGYEETDKSLAEIAREAEAGLRSDKQRAAFRRLWLQQRSGSLNSVARHIAKERRTYRQNAAEVGAKAALEDIAANYDNPQMVDQHLATGKAMIRANLAGQAPEVIAEKEAAYVSNARAAVVERMAQSDPMAAQDYYLAHKDEIDGLTQGKIEKHLETQTLRAESQATTDRIVAGGGTLAEQLAQARAIEDPKLRDETVTRVKTRYNEAKSIQAAAERDAKEAAWQVITAGGTPDDLTPQQLSVLGLQVDSMWRFVQNRAQRGNGFANATDPAVENNLHNTWMDDKAGFADLDLNQYRNKLTERDFDYWRTQQRAINKAAARESAKAPSYTLADRIAKEYLNAAGIDYGKSASKKQAQQAQKVLSLARSIVDTMAESDKKPTRQDVEQGLSELFLSGEIQGSGLLWDDSARLFEVVGTPDAANFVLTDIEEQAPLIARATGVPQDMIADIVAVLARKKLPVTPANIQLIYEKASNAR